MNIYNPFAQQEQQQIINPDEDSAAIDEINKLKAQYDYDNEWIKYIAELAENTAVKDIVDYINGRNWSDNQKEKIMAYTKVMLNRSLSTTNITSVTDHLMALDDFYITHIKVKMGLTKFDATDDFNILMQMIENHYKLDLRRSRAGMFVNRIGTQRTEFIKKEDKKDQFGLFKE